MKTSNLRPGQSLLWSSLQISHNLRLEISSSLLNIVTCLLHHQHITPFHLLPINIINISSSTIHRHLLLHPTLLTSDPHHHNCLLHIIHLLSREFQFILLVPLLL